jgi:acetyl-CoA carboxylase biotin carboxyl carrier protein
MKELPILIGKPSYITRQKKMISNQHSSFILGVPIEELTAESQSISMEQLQRLVRLIDQSDTVDLEIRQAGTESRLVLRKARPTTGEAVYVASPAIAEEETDSSATAEEAHYTITAPCVGLFQSWAKVKDKPLVAVGASIQEGQHVGIVMSLGIPEEVESPVAGRVVAILVQDGQPVEYGQPLMTVEQE